MAGQTAIAAFLIALAGLAKVYGYTVELTAEDAAAIAAGVITVISVLSTLATSRKVGIGKQLELQDEAESSNQAELDLRGGP